MSAWDTTAEEWKTNWLPGHGGSSASVTAGTWNAKSADLNGDTCADVALAGFESVTLVLGTPNGPTGAGWSKPITLPAGSDASPTISELATMRYQGRSQVFLSGESYNDGNGGLAYLWVMTLNPTASDATVERIAMAKYGAVGYEAGMQTVVADAGVVAYGSPTQNVSRNGKKRWSAGAVHIFQTSTTDPTKLVYKQQITQDSPGIASTVEAADLFGYELALRDGRLAIASEESINGVSRAGLVQPLKWNSTNGSYQAYPAIYQGKPGVPGKDVAGDRFGSALAIGTGYTETGSYDILIGTPRKAVSSQSKAGSVTVANFTKPIYRRFLQGSAGVPGQPKKGNRFGTQVLSLRTGSVASERLLATAPGESSGSCSTVGGILASTAGQLSVSPWERLLDPCESTTTEVIKIGE